MKKVAINGFGRIGRLTFRNLVANQKVDVVAINDLTKTEVLAHLLKYDTAHGKFNGTVEYTENSLIVNGKSIQVTAIKDPSQLPWGTMGIDVVIESTGLFTDADSLNKHLEAGAKKVALSAPAKGGIKTIVLGVNDHELTAEDTLISNASCTTNCLAPMMKVMEMVLSTLMPRSEAIFMSCSQARWARPSEVRWISTVNTAISTSVETMIRICMLVSRTMNSPASVTRVISS